MPDIGTLVVPKRSQATLKWLSASSPDVADRILEALKDETIKSPRELERAVEHAVEPSPSSQVSVGQEISSMLFALLSLHFTHDWPTADIASEIAKKVPLDDQEQRERLQSWLTEALSAKPVARLAKAYDVATDHQYVFHTCRILTDIRPVFGSASNVEPLGAVITHQLKLDYYERSGHNEFYLALDDDDLDELEQAIKRARQKGESLRSFLKSTGLPDMNVAFD